MSKFRLQSKSLFLTYKSHIDSTSWYEAISKKSGRTFNYKLSHETGKTGYQHTHILVFSSKQFNTRDPRYFDFLSIHPNLKPIKTKCHWKNLVNYTVKEGVLSVQFDNLTGNEMEWLGSVRNVIQSHKTWADVINDDYLTPYIQRYMKWATEVFNAKPVVGAFDIEEEYGQFLPWQALCLEKLKSQDKRSIMWIYDKEGNNGKSELSDHIEDQLDGLCVESGSYKDIAYLWQREKNIVFDLCRSQEEFTPYKAMESFKKGRLTSTKYQTVRKKMDNHESCNVVVFSNYMPDISKSSIDRWDIYTLDKGVLTARSPYGDVRSDVMDITFDNLRETSISPIISKVPSEPLNIIQEVPIVRQSFSRAHMCPNLRIINNAPISPNTRLGMLFPEIELPDNIR